jgi:hypothetical protein
MKVASRMGRDFAPDNTNFKTVRARVHKFQDAALQNVL